MRDVSQAHVLSFPFWSHPLCCQVEYGNPMPKEMHRHLRRWKQCLQDLISNSVD